MLSYVMPLISSPWLYLIIFLLVAVDGFVPVAMSEAIIIGLAAFSTTGSPNLAALAAAAMAGGITGDRISYYVGGKAGARIRNGKLARAKEKAEQALLRQGGAAIVIARFIPYGRTATTLTAGSVKLRLGSFYLASAVSSLLWAAYSIGLGRLGGAAFANSPLLGAALGIALGFVLAGLHSAVKRLRVLLAPARSRLRLRLAPVEIRLRLTLIPVVARLRLTLIPVETRWRLALIAVVARLRGRPEPVAEAAEAAPVALVDAG